MPGGGITKLGRPRRRYSAIGKARFDIKRAKLREDRKRARLLRWTVKKYDLSDPEFAAALRALADRIDPETTRKPQTLASARYMRRHRLRITGELWRLYEEGDRQARTFTLLPHDHKIEPDQLDGVDPRKLLSQLRHALIRAGSNKADGWLFIGLHAEYDPEAGLYHVHFHGLASGGMLEVVRRLRKQERYRPRPIPGSTASTRPVRIRRKPLTNVPGPLTYIVQSWWPCRRRKAEESRQSPCPRQRIPEPAHSQWLRWFDQWRLEDVILMVGLRVVNGKLDPR